MVLELAAAAAVVAWSVAGPAVAAAVAVAGLLCCVPVRRGASVVAWVVARVGVLCRRGTPHPVLGLSTHDQPGTRTGVVCDRQHLVAVLAVGADDPLPDPRPRAVRLGALAELLDEGVRLRLVAHVTGGRTALWLAVGVAHAAPEAPHDLRRRAARAVNLLASAGVAAEVLDAAGVRVALDTCVGPTVAAGGEDWTGWHTSAQRDVSYAVTGSVTGSATGWPGDELVGVLAGLPVWAATASFTLSRGRGHDLRLDITLRLTLPRSASTERAERALRAAGVALTRLDGDHGRALRRTFPLVSAR